MPKFFVYPFAEFGDLLPIPNTLQVDGSVSYYQGWGPDYGLDLSGGPPALPIPRNSTNQLYFDITDNINQYQTHGVPEFITSADNLGSPYPYDQYARVRYNPGSGYKLYENQVSGNTALPTDPSWIEINGSQVPPGTMMPFAGPTIPSGFLACDGSNVSRTTYANLFAAIGITWGPGDGSTTFTLPSMARRTVVGSGGTAYPGVLPNTLGAYGGSEGVTLTPSQMADHVHGPVSGYSTFISNPKLGGRTTLSFISGGQSITTGILGVAGGVNQAHPNIQPSAIINWMIKT